MVLPNQDSSTSSPAAPVIWLARGFVPLAGFLPLQAKRLAASRATQHPRDQFLASIVRSIEPVFSQWILLNDKKPPPPIPPWIGKVAARMNRAADPYCPFILPHHGVHVKRSNALIPLDKMCPVI